MVDSNTKITQSTMALIPAYHEVYKTIILDQSGEKRYSTKSIREILEENCIANGASYDGRIQSVRKALGYDKKTPLMISQQDYIFACPTISPDHYDCIWLFYRHIETFSMLEGKPYVHFKDGNKLEVNCSLDTLKRQRDRTANTMFYFSQPPFLSISIKHQA
jgi:competence protein ComK